MLLLETTGIYLRLPVSTPGRSECLRSGVCGARGAGEDDDPRAAKLVRRARRTVDAAAGGLA